MTKAKKVKFGLVAKLFFKIYLFNILLNKIPRQTIIKAAKRKIMLKVMKFAWAIWRKLNSEDHNTYWEKFEDGYWITKRVWYANFFQHLRKERNTEHRAENEEK